MGVLLDIAAFGIKVISGIVVITKQFTPPHGDGGKYPYVSTTCGVADGRQRGVRMLIYGLGMLTKSNENWETGKTCLESGRINVAASRVYYAVFQVVYEYAQACRGYKKNRDGGVHADMAQIVDVAINDKRYSGKLYRRLKLLRETADYDVEPADGAKLRELLPEAERIRNIFIGKNREAQ